MRKQGTFDIKPLGKVRYNYLDIKSEDQHTYRAAYVTDMIAREHEGAVTLGNREIVNVFVLDSGIEEWIGLQQQVPEEPLFVIIDVENFKTYIENGLLEKISGLDL